MKYNRRLVTIRSLIARGQDACIVCGLSVSESDAILIVGATRRISCMTLRHRRCVRSAYRPVHGAVAIERLIECMVASPFKLCYLCKKSWVGCELDDLVVVKGTRHVVHTLCIVGK